MANPFSFRLPHKLILFCRDNRLLKELSFFLYLKYCYTNSCIYNYQIKTLAQKTGYSRTKIKRMVGIFLKQGWCEMRGNNLVFKNRTKIIQHTFTFLLRAHLDEKEILTKLYLYLLTQKKEQCMRAYRCRRDLKNPKSLKDYKQAVKSSRKKEFLDGISASFTISQHGLSRVFNCSVSMGSTILRNLEKKLLLHVDRIKKVVMRCTHKVAAQCNLPATFWRRGVLIKVCPNRVTIAAEATTTSD